MGSETLRLAPDDVALLVDALRISGGSKSDYAHLRACDDLARRLLAWDTAVQAAAAKLCPVCGGNLNGGGYDWCDCSGGDEPVDHVYQRRGSWRGDDWCAVEGCTSRPSAHSPTGAAGDREGEG